MAEELVPLQEPPRMQSDIELGPCYEDVGVLDVVDTAVASGLRTTQRQTRVTIKQRSGDGPLSGTTGP